MNRDLRHHWFRHLLNLNQCGLNSNGTQRNSVQGHWIKAQTVFVFCFQEKLFTLWTGVSIHVEYILELILSIFVTGCVSVVNSWVEFVRENIKVHFSVQWFLQSVMTHLVEILPHRWHDYLAYSMAWYLMAWRRRETSLLRYLHFISFPVLFRFQIQRG